MSFDKDRLAVAIGKHGDVKKRIEELSGTKITIDSKTGDYHIEADPRVDPSTLGAELESPGIRTYCTNFVLQAINVGFNPEKALKLLDNEFMLEIIDLEKILGKSDKKIKRMKGRLIGDQGKIRASIEQFTGVNFSVYKKYLALIGDFETIKIAKKAINFILQGSSHKTVMDYLQGEYRKRKQEEFTKMWKPAL
ncbi:MAG: KH domain-containing protein [Promethearchaeota archaeon]